MSVFVWWCDVCVVRAELRMISKPYCMRLLYPWLGMLESWETVSEHFSHTARAFSSVVPGHL